MVHHPRKNIYSIRDYFFGSAITGEIDKEVQKLRKEGIIQRIAMSG